MSQIRVKEMNIDNSEIEKSRNSGFKYLEHTADVYYEAYGPTLMNAFNNAVIGFLDTVTGGEGGKKRPKEIIKEFEGSAINIEELIVYTLSDILTYMDSEEVVFYDSEILDYKAKKESYDNKFHIKLRLYGNRDRPRESVKAVTFHMLKIYKNENNIWHIRILLDV